MFSALGIPFHPDVEAFCLDQRRERTPFSHPSRSLDDVLQSDWSVVLNGPEKRRSLDLLGGLLVELGYESRESLDRASWALA